MKSLSFGTRRLVSQENNSLIQRPDIPRATFINRWSRKTTFDQGLLVPFMVDEIYPGDHVKYDATALVRIATTLFPIFSNLEICTFFFFTPYRLVWDNWTRFMGEQLDPDQSIDLTIPKLTGRTDGYLPNTVMDHMGLPVEGQTAVGQSLTVSALPFRAYNLIYNEWFRDQNIIDSVTVNTGDAADPYTNYATMQRRAKAHDYFTTLLPWPQKFDSPEVPIGGTAPVRGIGVNVLDRTASTGPQGYFETDGNTDTYNFFRETNLAGASLTAIKMTAATDTEPMIFADLTDAVGVSVNTLRESFLIQQLLERDARSGTRYTEILTGHFGVRSPDGRLQRPEYIGGGISNLNIQPIPQTAPTEDAPLGTLGGAGTATGRHTATFAAPEHGVIIALINVRAELSYQQGVPRMFDRSTRYDFAWPALSQLGEQAVFVRELYSTGDGTVNDTTILGYQERYHELRTRTNEITGMFRSTTVGSIDQWHLAQEFGSTPTLSQAFIEDDAPMERVLAAGELSVNQQFLADILIDREITRALPSYGTPALLGRF